MDKKRVRITDIAEELGVSTATVSNVIHGKTKKISDETVKRVQQRLEEREYIPSMAGILLAQNNSKIIGVIVNNHSKYENRVLQDPFIYGSLDYLSEEIKEYGYEMMIKISESCEDIVRYASMWNMAGLIMIGFCEQDYEKIRGKMHIPLVAYDGFFKKVERFGNISIDNMDGGYQMGNYLISKGHRKILYLADNTICMDAIRYKGLCKALEEHDIPIGQEMFRLIPLIREKRLEYYMKLLLEIKDYTAAFCASDRYAIEFMNFLTDSGVAVGKEFSIAGFDNIPEATLVRPTLTTIQQDLKERAVKAIELIDLQKNGNNQEEKMNICLPVQLKIRESVCDIEKVHNK
ncbi:MAG: LacI family DNA-binding transcriptional regulator [Cellulosilyticaceae bacterium]